jgi:hypothetical protein
MFLMNSQKREIVDFNTLVTGIKYITLLKSERNCDRFIMKFEDVLTDKRY